jgi:hypothetical protein
MLDEAPSDVDGVAFWIMDVPLNVLAVVLVRELWR